MVCEVIKGIAAIQLSQEMAQRDVQSHSLLTSAEHMLANLLMQELTILVYCSQVCVMLAHGIECLANNTVLYTTVFKK